MTALGAGAVVAEDAKTVNKCGPVTYSLSIDAAAASALHRAAMPGTRSASF